MAVFLPGESHRQRSLTGYSGQGRKEPDMTEATEHSYCFYEYTENLVFYGSKGVIF